MILERRIKKRGAKWFIDDQFGVQRSPVIAPALGAGGRRARGVTTPAREDSMFVYILYSEKRSRYYIGQTVDINERLERHNKSVVPSTKGGAPWELIWKHEVSDRSEAMILERRIKKRGAKWFIDDQFGVQRSPVIAPALGAGGRRFESCHPDKIKRGVLVESLLS